MSQDIQTSFDKFILPKLASFLDILISALNKSCVTQMSLNFLRLFLNIVQQLHKSLVCTCACACFYPCACLLLCLCLRARCDGTRTSLRTGLPPSGALRPCSSTHAFAGPVLHRHYEEEDGNNDDNDNIDQRAPLQAQFCMSIMRKRVTKMIENDHTIPKMPPFA